MIFHAIDVAVDDDSGGCVSMPLPRSMPLATSVRKTMFIQVTRRGMMIVHWLGMWMPLTMSRKEVDTAWR